MNQNWDVRQIFQTIPIATFVLNLNHEVVFWNKACETLTNISASEIRGTQDHREAFYGRRRKILADIILDGVSESQLNKSYKDKWRYSPNNKSNIEVVDFLPKLGKNGAWIYFVSSLLKDDKNEVIGSIETLQDITERVNAQENLKVNGKKLNEMNITMRNILENLQCEKKEVQENIATNIERSIKPTLNKLILQNPSIEKELQFVTNELDNISTGFYRKLAVYNHSLTQSEMNIAKHVRTGCSEKEIADLLCVSVSTVKKHKNAIRKKFNISNQAVRLSTYLQDL